MISFQAPLWLLLLSLIPLILWLHRFSLLSRIVPSTTVFLWASLRQQAGRDGSPGKPDPRWMLRALIATFLILALAKPYQQNTQEQTVDVWIDDSLSMFTREHEQQRIQTGLQQLQSYLVEHNFARIQLHSLGDPSSSLSLDPDRSSRWGARLEDWVNRPRAEPLAPAADLLSAQSNHILITDGADSALNLWAQSAPLVHIIRVGKLRQNIALSRLSLRKSLKDGGDIAGIARVANLGDQAQRVTLTIEQQDDVIENREVDIPPSSNIAIPFAIAAGARGFIQARVASSADPLSLDNSLQLELAQLEPSIGYRIVGDCDPQIMAVINSQPAFIEVDRSAELMINCSGEMQPSNLPALVLHRPVSKRRSTQTAHWHKELLMDKLPVAAGVAYSDDAPALSSGNIPILSADARLLILKQTATPNIIDLYLDTADPEFSRQALYPLVIQGLLGHLIQRDLEITPLTIERDLKASRITAMPFSSNSIIPSAGQPARSFITTVLILTALLLLVADAALSLFVVSGKRQ